jgi:hypothetical protein
LKKWQGGINMDKEKPKETKKKKEDFLNFLLWWKLDNDELQKQIEQYDTLPLSQSARGQSVICLLIAALLTTIMVIFFNFDKAGFIDVVISLILSFFIFKGYKWAIIMAMILWTLGKFLLLIDTSMTKRISINPLLQIVWWALFMHYFYLAFKVERLRAKMKRG